MDPDDDDDGDSMMSVNVVDVAADNSAVHRRINITAAL